MVTKKRLKSLQNLYRVNSKVNDCLRIVFLMENLLISNFKSLKNIFLFDCIL